MPTILTHAIAAAALGSCCRPRLDRARSGRFRLPRGFWLLTVACAVLPDADVIAFDLGLDYGHMLGHRGLSHSLAFAVSVGAAASWALGRGEYLAAYPTARLALFVHFSLATASHGLLDAFTDDGLGVAFLAPFSGDRFFFPWRPLEVSPIGGHGFFTARDVQGGLRWVEVLWSEFRWVWIPAGLVAGAVWRLRQTSRASG